MKVIDLLNKIANGEKVPKKIKVYDREYEFDEYNTYRNREMLGTLGQHYSLDGMLNDEVEIIEDKPKEDIQVLSRWYSPKEDKKIEKIQLTNGGLTIHLSDFEDYNLTIIDREIIKKLNEIIERLNSEDNDKS